MRKAHGLLLLIVMFTACESAILPDLKTQIVDEATPRFTLSLETDGNGTVPTSEFTLRAGEPTTITAASKQDYVFVRWETVKGEGVEIEDAESATTTVTLTSDDALLRATFIARQYLALKSPNGGETVTRNGSLTISWDSLNLTGTVRVELLSADGSWVRTIATSVPVSAETYTWDTIDEPIVDLGAYLIGVTLETDESFTDTSDAVFTISSLAVTGPAGSAIAYTAGGTCPITWDSEMSAGTLRISVVDASDTSTQIASGVPVTDGQYDWSVPGTLDSGPYTIRLLREDEENLRAASAEPFYLLQEVTVSAPSFSEVTAGEQISVVWECIPAGTATVELVRASGGSTSIVTGQSNNRRTATWTIPASTMPATDYSVRVRVNTVPERTASSSTFTVKPPPVTSVSASDGASTAHVALSWSSVPNSPSYTIMRRADGSSTSSAVTTVPQTTYHDDSATPGTRYHYSIRPTVNSVTNTAGNEDAGFRMIETPVMTQLLPSGSSLRAYWGAVTGDTVTEVWRSTFESSNYSKVGQTSGSTTWYADSGVTRGQRYYYKTRSYSPVTGWTPLSPNPVSGFVTLLAPENFTVSTNSDAYVFLDWDAPAGAVTGYRIYRKDFNENTWSWSWSQIATTGLTSYNDAPPVVGAHYYYRAEAYNGITGGGADTAEVLGYVTPMAPTEFSAYNYTLGSGTITHLSWYSGPGDDFYEIQEVNRIWLQPIGHPASWHYTYVDVATVYLPDQEHDIPHDSGAYQYRIRAVHDGPFVGDNTYSTWAYVDNP